VINGKMLLNLISMTAGSTCPNPKLTDHHTGENVLHLYIPH